MESWKADFTKVMVWQMAFELSIDVYGLTRGFPPEERFGLSSQMSRAAVGIVACIAEGYARRRPRDKDYLYTVAHSSAQELKSELMVAERLKYLDPLRFDGLMTRLDEIGRMLYGMIESMEARLHPT
jgi:four helix bundle protein